MVFTSHEGKVLTNNAQEGDLYQTRQLCSVRIVTVNNGVHSQFTYSGIKDVKNFMLYLSVISF